ncbi:MAG: heavy metal translocating P-type ATPase, partial [Actinomycetota bacterium]|nr:heavy metal translocating P-type ATPase [Actinomycetota bacterium]
GTLVVRVTRVGEESFLSQVARSIEEARALRPGVLQLVDVVLKYYVPGVLIFAAAGFVGWTLGPLLFGGGPNFFRATFAALAVLVLGYPCALGMATPLAMIRGGGEAARQGILMRSGEAFQIMGELRSMVLDKTGTITRGEPSLQEIVAPDDRSDDQVLQTAASAESASEHPLARAIEQGARERDLEVTLADDFRSHTGKGVEATVEGARVLVGKPGFLDEQGVDLDDARDEFTRLEQRGLTVVGVARDGRLLGLIGIGDAVKADAEEAIERIKDAGMTPVMITGDNRRTAEAVAAEVGIERVLAEVLPEDKAAEVRSLQDEGQRVAMVGDGINDAPALTQADVGIAIGAGTDIAIESADIVVMSDRLGAVMDAHDIGVRSYRQTKQNLALAFAFNGIGVPAATTGFVHPIWAMIAMVASVTLVLTNSFAGRLLRRARSEEASGDGTRQRPEDGHRREHDHGEDAGGERAPAPAAPAHDDPSEGGRQLRLRVPMHCDNCARRIQDRLSAMDGVRQVRADHERDSVTIRHTPEAPESQIRARLHDMGFDVTGYADQDRETPA